MAENHSLKREAIALISRIPDDKTELLAAIVKGIRKEIDADFQDDIYSRAEQDLALMEEAENLVGEGGDAKVGEQ